MKTIKIGATGEEVKILQTKLKALTYYFGYIDGQFGPQTHESVIKFQRANGLYVDGVVGAKTWGKLNSLMPKIKLDPNYFTVWLDAGHGSIHPQTGRYTTNGKYFDHKDSSIHVGDGFFYEGYENRIVADMAASLLEQNNINVVRLYHPYEDVDLEIRSQVVQNMQKVGHYGWVHSIHSNAISTSYSKEKLDNTQGGIIFTTRGQNFSDKVGNILYNEWNIHFGKKQTTTGKKWLWGVDSDGDADREANFYITRNTESRYIASTLGEFGFFTSHPDTKFIIHPDTRYYRAYSILKTAIKLRNEFKTVTI